MILALLLLLCSWLVAGDLSLGNEDEKKLVFFAGPHGTYENQIKTYLHKWNIHGWKWPKPNDERQKDHNLLDLLVTDPKRVAYDGMYARIHEAWQNSTHGMIVGSEFFDQIGPYARYNAIDVMDSLVERLSVPPDNVVVILNYRRTRIDQWISICQKNTVTSYRNFMCDSQYDKILLEKTMDMLGSQLNPLNAAYEYLEGGWNVKLIDLEGVHQANRDVSHVIVCNVLQGECDENGLFIGHESSRTTKEQDLPKLLEDLSEMEMNKISLLFQYRDCDFQPDLRHFFQDDKLEVMFNRDLWGACDPDLSHLYRQIGDNEIYMYEALLSQLECSRDHIFTIDQALGLDDFSESDFKEDEAAVDEQKSSSVTKSKDPSSEDSIDSAPDLATNTGREDSSGVGMIVIFEIGIALIVILFGGIACKLMIITPKNLVATPISYKRRDKQIFDHGRVVLETVLNDDSDYDEANDFL